MPGTKSGFKPLSACESSGSASDEESHLDLHLQRQLEEDVARIFDESIYSDLEVVCGKLKILTHSCILKARTHKFYHKLETILRLNIERDTFDEIYSFISDAYTECNIQRQEKEFINYLNNTLSLSRAVTSNNNKTRKQKGFDDTDVFSTPHSTLYCVNPEGSLQNTLSSSIELNAAKNYKISSDVYSTIYPSNDPESAEQKPQSSSPSKELNKEYYALVPIEGNILEKELIEQDALSSAFKSFIKSQEDLNSKQNKQCVKPTSLFLNSSHISKLNKHSDHCDIVKQFDIKEIEFTKQKNNSHNKLNNASSQVRAERVTDAAYSPDSLVTDEPSSSSDYLSATYTVSPGIPISECFSQINICEYPTKMENTFTVTDSGLETTGMLESLNSHKDVTLTDLSLTESTFLDMVSDEATNNHDSLSSTSELKQLQKLKIFPSQHSISATTSSEGEYKDIKQNKPPLLGEASGTSSKEEKQRQNEEIVILESSSLSSETGSWESVFPPKSTETEICQTFINSEREHMNYKEIASVKNKTKTTEITNITDELCPSLVQKSPFKSTSCFIDAASLADEGDETMIIHEVPSEAVAIPQSENVPITKCKPIACVRKYDQSPDDLSEGIDNEDSLEKADRDPDSIQKDESPTIFEMTPITEDSLCANGFENVPEQQTTTDVPNPSNEASLDISAERPQNRLLTIFSSTPNNSIISLRTYDANESEESENDSVISRRECNDRLRKQAIDSMMHLSESPIVSGGASVEDHLPQLNSHSGSPMCRRKVENMPIVSGAYVPIEEERPERSPRPSSNAAAWVVDMSCDTKPEINKVHSKPGDRACESLKLSSRPASSGDSCKSRSSVDSDSSERSTQKFYIDLSTLPDALPPERPNEEENNEKKNIFSLFIDLGDKTTVKEMPARLSSSIGKKKTAKTENKSPANQTTKSTSDSLKTTTTVDECTFEKLESLCNDPNISITEIIQTRSSQGAPANKDTENFESIISEQPRSLTNDIVESMIHEEAVPDNSTNDIFVKLSDLDKPVQISDVKVVLEKTHHFERMTRSIPENNWTETCSTNSRSVDIISSFHSENTLSLNRLFPHLKNDFSRSMPGCLSSRTRSPMRMGTSMSPGDGDDHVSDVSEMSSVQSSMCRSIVENSTTEETSQTASLISSCQSRLGQDLLRMFLEEIAPDVIVEVSGRRIKAHKCILSSRCQYFAAMLSGGWVESAGNVIVLPPFSFSVVHFALCHIYSGVSMIPDSISIVELATIADMLGLEGLKEAIMFTLKAKYCHHFHKPCQVCTAGVLECFPLSSVYGLDDLYRKCLRWITKYFHKVWPTKAFATLPSELLDKCYQEHIINLTTDNFVDTVYGCGMTVASLQSSRWADVVARMCRRLINAAAQFAAARLAGVLRALAEHPLGAPRPATQALHDCLSAAIEWAPPDEACKAYAFLSNLVNNDHFVKPDLIANGNQGKSNNLLQSHAASWQLQCEGALVRAAPRVVGSQAFKELPNELRKRLRELGCIMFGQALPLTPSPLSIRKARSPHRKTNKSHTSRSLDIDQVRASFVPYAPKPQPLAPVGSLDLLTGADQKTSLKSNKAAPPQVRTTKAQEKRAKYNLIKTFQPPTSVAPGKTARLPYENTKPRYLEPRVAKENERSVKKPAARMVSSSESSRNSSPLVGRARDKFSASRDKTSMSYDKTSVTRDKTSVSHDSLATSSRPRTADPSTDSLSESNNKYATYTKSKYQTKRSTESIQSAKHYQNSTSSNKAKSTKIPVYLKNAKNPPPALVPKNKNSGSAQDRSVKENRSSSVQPKQNERKPSCSLMNATKSSIAKIVPKVLKESPNKTYTSKSGKGNSKQGSRSPPQEIPIMERSGTFLKDEPMFGDKTTNIDIDD